MSAKRMEMHRLQELVRLHRKGRSGREIARLLKMGRNTVGDCATALADAGLLEGEPDELPDLEEIRAVLEPAGGRSSPPQQVSSIAQWEPVVSRLVAKGNAPKAIYDFLRLEHRKEFSGTLSAVKRMCRRLDSIRPVRAEDVVIPVESEPGEAAQVDFGFVGRLFDPELERPRKAWAFVMVLGYSRHLYVDIVFDQRIETWLQLHIAAFARLGGVPRVVRPDNLKAAVVRAAFTPSDDCELNRSYAELARYYDFQIDPTPPRQPNKKGKVESGVKYVKRSYFGPREFADIDEARRGLEAWITEIAGTREHGTTRRQPLTVFEEEERPALLSLPTQPYELVVWKRAKVHTDSHISFDRRLYSVPWANIGTQVWVRATPSMVAIYADDTRIATHSRRGLRPRSTVDGHLPDHRVEYRHRQPEYWKRKAGLLGEEVEAFVAEVFEQKDALLQLRAVQGIVGHLEKFPVERARAACRRARYYGNYSYRGIKDILRRGLDFEPLPDEAHKRHGRLEQPRFARRPLPLLQLMETSHEPN